MRLPAGNPPSESTLEMDITHDMVNEYRQVYPDTTALSPSRKQEGDDDGLGYDVAQEHPWGRAVVFQYKSPRYSDYYVGAEIGEFRHLSDQSHPDNGQFIKFEVDREQLKILQQNFASDEAFYAIPATVRRLSLPHAIGSTLFVDVHDFPDPNIWNSKDEVRMGVPALFSPSWGAERQRLDENPLQNSGRNIHFIPPDHMTNQTVSISTTDIHWWRNLRAGIFDGNFGSMPTDIRTRKTASDGGQVDYSKVHSTTYFMVLGEEEPEAKELRPEDFAKSYQYPEPEKYERDPNDYPE